MALSSRPRAQRSRGPAKRFGIGEWYGKSFLELSQAERRSWAEFQMPPQRGKPAPVCPFQSLRVACNKVGGVCTLRMYQQLSPTDEATLAPGTEGRLRTVCPNRFEEDGLIYQWVGQRILGSPAPVIVSEVGFLERNVDAGEQSRDDVGRIDKVLVVPDSSPLLWCALEVQAVYFSGDAMSKEWPAIKEHRDDGLPFPSGRRRPDYRSSGPKRLMPQLQIKVPSLRRWGKKMAVVVDLDFWEALGTMDHVRDVSNCDIAWFIVGYDGAAGSPKLILEDVCLTTLERSVEGLTAGVPVSLELFEQRIVTKLRK